jgi:hypothetical protein
VSGHDPVNRPDGWGDSWEVNVAGKEPRTRRDKCPNAKYRLSSGGYIAVDLDQLHGLLELNRCEFGKTRRGSL